MIRVSAADESFDRAIWNARRALPVEQLETPRQYGERWRETYRCRVERGDQFPNTYYVFDRDEDYTWFMLKWST